MGKGNSRAAQNNKSNQGNSNNPAYHSSRQGSGNSKPDSFVNQNDPSNAPTKPDSSNGSGTP